MTPLTPTAGQTIGPFFGFALPYAAGPALVPDTHPDAVRLHGRVLDGAGRPVPDALLELSQAGPDGVLSSDAGSLVRDGVTFTGWGRCPTDEDGRYSFTTLAPGGPGAPFFAITVLARGLTDRLSTRAYLPGADDALLAGLDADRRATLLTTRDETGYHFDVRLQGDHETVFLSYPRD